MTAIGRRAHRTGEFFTFVAFSLLSAAFLLIFPKSVIAGPAGVWFADHKTVKRIDPQTNVVVQSVRVPDKVESLAVDPRDGSMLVLSRKHLRKFTASGNPILKLNLKRVSRGLNRATHLVLNPHDGSFWVAGHKSLVRIDSEGRPLAEWQSESIVRAITLDVDDSIWVLTGKRINHLTPQATVVESIGLRRHLRNHRYLSVDRLGGALWVASPRQVLRFNLANLTDSPQIVVNGYGSPMKESEESDDADRHEAASNNDRGRNVAIAVHPIMGTLWVLTGDEIHSYGLDGAHLQTLDLTSYNLGRVRALALDSTTSSLWIAGNKGIGHFTEIGEFLGGVSANKKAGALGIVPFRVVPTLSVLEPIDGSLTQDPFSLIRLAVGVKCGEKSCFLGESYYGSFVFDAYLNGQPVGSRFEVIEPEATMRPEVQLLEGGNTFSAKAIDQYGHTSNLVESHFTVDTVPPEFLSITPADGSVSSVENITIQGQLDEPSGHVLLLDANGAVVDSAGPAFSFNVALSPGENHFTLAGYDQAANETKVTLSITYQTSTIVVTEPVPGSTVDTDALTLCGTYQGPRNTGITVNGVIAITDGSHFCVNGLPLSPDENILTITMTFQDGSSTVQSAGITSVGAAPFGVSVWPQDGIAPLNARFGVIKNGAADIVQIVADFNGDGIAEVNTSDPSDPLEYVYTAPGIYRPVFTITDSDGFVSTLEKALAVRSAEDMDAMLRGIYEGMLDRLKVGDIDGALNALTGGSREKHRSVFSALKPDLATVVDQLRTVEGGTIGKDMAEYVIVRDDQAFLIYFLRSEDGVWRIDGM